MCKDIGSKRASRTGMEEVFFRRSFVRMKVTVRRKEVHLLFFLFWLTYGGYGNTCFEIEDGNDALICSCEEFGCRWGQCDSCNDGLFVSDMEYV